MTSTPKDQPKTLEDALAVIESKNFAIECLESENKAMTERLSLLRCHKVYVFFGKDGRMLYVGQDRGGAKSRIYDHLSGAIKQGAKSNWETKLVEELKEGVYAAVVFDKLDEFEADEHETFLIETLDENDKGNQLASRSTRRLELLTVKQRKIESELLKNKALEIFDSLKDDDLITIENVNEKLKGDGIRVQSVSGICTKCDRERRGLRGGKCWDCQFGFTVDGECQRCKRANRINSDLYCKSCNSSICRAKAFGKELEPYDSTKSRKDVVVDNKTERALAYNLYKREISPMDWHGKIVKIIGSESTAKDATVKGWNSTQFNNSKKVFNINTFLSITQDKPLSDEATNSLIIYERSRNPQPTSIQTLMHLNNIFGADTLHYDKVQAVYTNAEQVKLSLKRAASDNAEAGDSKRAKVEE